MNLKSRFAKFARKDKRPLNIFRRQVTQGQWSLDPDPLSTGRVILRVETKELGPAKI
jgi:hypothetical protein